MKQDKPLQLRNDQIILAVSLPHLERDDAADGKNPIRKSVRERSMLKGRKLLNINGDVNSARDLTSPI